jgi:hypothetical protein
MSLVLLEVKGRAGGADQVAREVEQFGASADAVAVPRILQRECRQRALASTAVDGRMFPRVPKNCCELPRGVALCGPLTQEYSPAG